MKQTAIEWLIKQLESKLESLPEYKLFEQAKEMEKQQIIDSYIEASENPALILDDAEQFYNETYESKI
jgi:ATP-dependent protease HslVU (ClpYQ) peptidase subunit